jgi:hypothetical protein
VIAIPKTMTAGGKMRRANADMMGTPFKQAPAENPQAQHGPFPPSTATPPVPRSASSAPAIGAHEPWRPVAQASHPQRPGNSNFDRFGYHGDIPDPSASPVESGAAAMEYSAENLFRQPRPTLCMASCKVLRLEKPLLNSPAVRAATNDKLHVPRVSYLQHL